MKHQNGRSYDNVSTVDERYMSTSTISDVKDAIKQLENNKTVGKDGIAVEVIKVRLDRLAACLHRLHRLTVRI